MVKQKTERKEAWMRIIVGIVSGIVLYVWFWFIAVLFVINLVCAIFGGKKIKQLAELSEVWNTQVYIYFSYMTFVSNQRPLPFGKLEENLSEIE